jgi:hypothetical protein
MDNPFLCVEGFLDVSTGIFAQKIINVHYHIRDVHGVYSSVWRVKHLPENVLRSFLVASLPGWFPLTER